MHRDNAVFHRLAARRPARKRRPAKLEALEARALLTAFYVDNNLLLTADRDHSGGLSPGDQVTFGNGQTYQQANLTYDAAPVDGDAGTAFRLINQALASPLVQAGDAIDVAGGAYYEEVTIDKSIALQGFGDVVLEPAPLIQPALNSGAPSSPATGVGITIDGNPDTVTLANLDVRGFRTGLLSGGAGTVNLNDVVLEAGGPPTFAADPFNGLSNVANLNVVDTKNQNEQVNLDPGPPMGLTPFLQTNSLAITLSNVTNLSITTSGGNETFNAAPIAKTITINGGGPPPQTDTLNIWYPTLTGNSATETATPQGYSGTVDFSGGDVLRFSRIATVSPVVVAFGGRQITATEGIATGESLLAQFTDPLGNLPLSDYSADINWGDGAASAGSVSFDSTTGIYTIIGNHTYAEEGDDLIAVVIHRAGWPDTTAKSSASVVEQPIVATPETLTGTAGVALGSGGQVLARFEQQAGDNEDFQATIDWGDGAASSGTVAEMHDIMPPMNRTFWSVDGSHTYAQAGTYNIHVSLTEGPNVVSGVTSTAAIAAATLTANQAFLTHVYADLLHRTPDANGLAFWSGQLEAGLARRQFVLGVEASPEYRQNEVTSLYERYLHRAPESAAMDADSQLLAGGLTDAQLAAIIVSSDEFDALSGGTTDGFLNALFQDALQRPIDASAKASFEQYLAAGATRAEIAELVFNSHEFHADLVQTIYLELLNRDADASGEVYWAEQLHAGASDEQAIAAIAASDEYFHKA